MGSILQARYTDFSNEDADYPNVVSIKKVGFMPSPRPTKASQSQSIARERKEEQVCLADACKIHSLHISAPFSFRCAQVWQGNFVTNLFYFMEQFETGEAQTFYHEALQERQREISAGERSTGSSHCGTARKLFRRGTLSKAMLCCISPTFRYMMDFHGDMEWLLLL